MSKFVLLKQSISGNIVDIYINSDFISEYSKDEGSNNSVVFCDYLYKIDVTETTDEITEKINNQSESSVNIVKLDCKIENIEFETSYVVENIVAFFDISEGNSRVITIKGNQYIVVNLSSKQVYQKLYV